MKLGLATNSIKTLTHDILMTTPSCTDSETQKEPGKRIVLFQLEDLKFQACVEGAADQRLKFLLKPEETLVLLGAS